LKPLAEITSIIQSHKPGLAEKYGVSEIGVFGSVVRGEAREEFDRPTDFIAFMNLLYYQEDLFGTKVDLVMRNALKPRIGKHILNEVMYG
jgi:predicted nucleotidyltransferase